MSESSTDIQSNIDQIKKNIDGISISSDQSINGADLSINSNSTNKNSGSNIEAMKNLDVHFNSDDENALNSNSEPSSCLQDGSEKIYQFCAAFNKKVGVSVNSLEEVLEIVDALITSHSGVSATNDSSLDVFKISQDNETVVQKLRNRVSKLKEKNKELQTQLNQNEMLNSSLQADVDQLKYQNNRLEETLADMQVRLQTSQQEVKELNDRTSRNKNSRNLLETTVSNLGELIQSQLDDSTTIIAQRDSLIKIINKQNSALQQYEQLLAKIHDENSKSCENAKSSKLNDSLFNDEDEVSSSQNDVFPLILTIVSKSSEQMKSDIKSRISDVVNDSSIPLVERISSVISVVCHEANEAIELADSLKSQVEKLKSANDDVQGKCIEILSLFDEEIQFMQRLAHSKEIQSCVFFREDQNEVIPFDQDSREELIKHCARVSRYIEETIPQINISEMSDAFSQFESIQPTEIFNLLNANVLEKKMRDFFDRMKKFNSNEISESSQFSEGNSVEIQMKELLCLFAAQAFTNDILQNHSVELRMRYEINQREIQQLRLEVEESKEPLKSMKKIIGHFTKRENKAKRVLSKVLRKSVEDSNDQSDSNLNEDDNNADLMSVVKSVAVLINENRFGQTEKLERELNQVIDEKSSMVEKLNKHIANIENELNKAQNVYEEKTKEFQETVAAFQSDIQSEKEKNDEYVAKIDELQKQLKEVTDGYNELRDGQQEAIKSVQEESDMHIQSLSSQLDLKMKRAKDLEDQLEQFGAKIEDLRKEKKEAKERIDYLETVNIKSVNALKEKSKSLRKQCEESIAQMQNQLQSAKEESVKSQEEVRELRAKNEELAVELSNCQIDKKAVELRAKTLNDRLETTKQTMASQQDAKIKSLTTQIEEKLSAINKEQKELISGFIQYANENLDAHFDIDIESELEVDLGFPTEEKECSGYDDSCLKRFVRYLQGELEARHHSQVVYEETAADIIKVQKLLKIPETSDLYGPVSRLLKSHKEMEEKVKKCQDDQIESEKRSSEYCREIRKVESQIASLRQWESWARRIHRIVHETCCTTYSSEQLRLSLEESLLSSVSQRAILAKLSSLREQKKALTLMINTYIAEQNKDQNLEGENLTSQNLLLRELPNSRNLRPQWIPLLVICAFVRRIQKLSGVLPIDYKTATASSLPLSCGVVENSQKKKKRNNRPQTFSQCNEAAMNEMPQRKPTALFKNI